jgi:DNA-binding transcriptional regulator YiaG
MRAEMPRPTTLPEPWISLARKLGGVQGLADALGVAPNTIYRWAHGQRKLSGPARLLFFALCRAHKVEP